MTIGLTAQRMIDPIAALVNRVRDDAGAHPVALVAMDIGITLTGGLAVVETKRTFRNDEAVAIEALLSLPVPVHAAFFGLTAKIDDRVLKGIAQAREEARETYEDAISEGKTAVLHEELLRGVHALSVGNLAPGAMIEVTTCWADTLRSRGTSCGRLRIPMTVGDVYGISDLPETDEPAHGDGLKSTFLRIRHDAGVIRIASGVLRASQDGTLVGEAPANAPIDIEVEEWKPGMLKSKSWDGRDVSLHMEPTETGEESVNVALGCFINRAVRLDRCIVNKYVNASEPVEHLPEGPLHLIRFRYVALDIHRVFRILLFCRRNVQTGRNGPKKTVRFFRTTFIFCSRSISD